MASGRIPGEDTEHAFKGQKVARNSLQLRSKRWRALPRGQFIARSGTSPRPELFFRLDNRGCESMKLARALLWAVGAAMCVVGILLFTQPIDVFDHVDQLKISSETETSTSSPVLVAPHLNPAEVAAEQPEVPPSPLEGVLRRASEGIAQQQAELPAVSPVQEAPPVAPAGIASQQQDRLNELRLDPPAQNSPHAIVPDATPAIVGTGPAAESESSPATEAIEVPSPAESPSPVAPKDEFVMITSAASLRDGPSAFAHVIGRAYAGARARVASRDAGWAQIVDPASGHRGWLDSSVLVPSPTTETAATENPSAEAPDGALERSLEDQSVQTPKSAHSTHKSKHAARTKRHEASHGYYGRPRFAFRFFLRRSFRR